MTSTPASRRPVHRLQFLAALALLAGQAGCTSLINTAVLREALLDAVDNPFDDGPLNDGPLNGAASAGSKGTDDQKDAAGKTVRSASKIAEGIAADVHADRTNGDGADRELGDPGSATRSGGSGRPADSPEVRQQKLAAALDEAIGRLSNVGGLDEPAQAALLSTLESTSPDDWPAVIDAFTSSLAAASPPAKPLAAVEPGPTIPPGSAVDPGPNLPPAQAGGLIFPIEPASSAVVVASALETLTLLPAGGPSQLLTVGNACFASRVRAWGAVDRFAADRFQPGQDVIVYFELENLTARASTAGHTTIIDTSLRLVDDGGRLVHEWSFDPIEETCHSRRRDYFARYLVRVPESTPAGRFRLEMAVTDVLAGRTAQTTLAMAVGDQAGIAEQPSPDGVQTRP